MTVTTKCSSCGIGPLTYPAWQGVPVVPMCPSCAHAASLARHAASVGAVRS